VDITPRQLRALVKYGARRKAKAAIGIATASTATIFADTALSGGGNAKSLDTVGAAVPSSLSDRSLPMVATEESSGVAEAMADPLTAAAINGGQERTNSIEMRERLFMVASDELGPLVDLPIEEVSVASLSEAHVDKLERMIRPRTPKPPTPPGPTPDEKSLRFIRATTKTCPSADCGK